ncbi:MAG: porphobilinogen synthase [Neomegalonema sp.]|nr:porphobilinogen synthase [Neomegalonema sp.]
MMNFKRFRRLRSAPWVREMFQETRLTAADLIQGVFVADAKLAAEPGMGLPGTERYRVDQLEGLMERVQKAGIPCVALFPCNDPTVRTEGAEEAWNPDGLLARSIREIRRAAPDVGIMTDVALDLYTNHGHDGVVDPSSGDVLNDETVELLVKQSLAQVEMGAHALALSDMMDGRVLAIREALEEAGHINTLLISHSAKTASSLYAYYRKTVSFDATPGGLDKRSYQISPANGDEAIREYVADIEEGADATIVKPAIMNLDLMARMKALQETPLIAFQVSGEYMMLRAMDRDQPLVEKSPMWESLISCKRAGASAIITYGALDVAENLL